jgi:hypothetical protein
VSGVLAFVGEWDITVGGTSVRDVLTDWTLGHQNIQLPQNSGELGGGWVAWELSATVVKPARAIALPLDDQSTFWARLQDVEVYLLGELFALLKLDAYSFDAHNPRSLSGQLVARCKLSVNNFDRAPKRNFNFASGGVEERVGSGRSLRIVPWTEVIGDALREIGLSVNTPPVFPVVPTLNYANNPMTDGYSAEPAEKPKNPVQYASDIAASHGYWLDARLGVVEFSKYPVNPDEAETEYYLQEIESFDRQDIATGQVGALVPPKTIRVTGRTLELSPTQDSVDQDGVFGSPPDPENCGVGLPPPVETFDEDGDLLSIETTDSIVVGVTAALIVTRKRTQAKALFGDPDAGKGLVTEYSKVEQTSYDSQGKPLTKITRLTEPRGVAAPSLYPSDQSQELSKITTEQWLYFGDGRQRQYSVRTTQNGKFLFADENAPGAFLFLESEVTNWQIRGCETVVQKTEYYKAVLGIDDYSVTEQLQSDRTSIQIIEGIPDPPYKERDQAVKPKTTSQQIETVPSFDPTTEEEKNLYVTAKHVTTDYQAQQLGETLLAALWGKRYARSISMPVDLDTVQNYHLFRVVDVYRWRLVTDAFSVAYSASDRQLGLFFSGNQAATLLNPLVIESEPVPVSDGALAIAPIRNKLRTQGKRSPVIRLRAAGGTPPYGFSVSGLPTGLTLSGGEISGTPTASGTFTVTAMVTDDALDTADTSFDITVQAKAIASPTASRKIKIDLPKIFSFELGTSRRIAIALLKVVGVELISKIQLNLPKVIGVSLAVQTPIAIALPKTAGITASVQTPASIQLPKVIEFIVGSNAPVQIDLPKEIGLSLGTRTQLELPKKLGIEMITHLNVELPKKVGMTANVPVNYAIAARKKVGMDMALGASIIPTIGTYVMISNSTNQGYSLSGTGAYTTFSNPLAFPATAQCVDVSPSGRVIIAGSNNNATAYADVSNLSSWTQVNAGGSVFNTNEVVHITGNIWLITGQSGYLRRTINNGVSYSTITAPGTPGNIFGAADNDAGKVMIAGSASYAALSSDSAASFNTVTNFSVSSRVAESVGFGNGRWMVGTTSGRISYTTNDGTLWSEVFPSGSATLTIWAVKWVQDDVWLAVHGSATTNGAVWRTTDGGVNWTSIGQPLGNTSYRAIVGNRNLLTLVDHTGQTCQSTDQGLTWSSASASGLSSVVAKLAVQIN